MGRYQNGELFRSYQNDELLHYQNGELFLLKWRISIYAYSQNGEFFAFVIECLIQKKVNLLPKFKTVDFRFPKKKHFSHISKKVLKFPKKWMSFPC